MRYSCVKLCRVIIPTIWKTRQTTTVPSDLTRPGCDGKYDGKYEKTIWSRADSGWAIRVCIVREKVLKFCNHFYREVLRHKYKTGIFTLKKKCIQVLRQNHFNDQNLMLKDQQQSVCLSVCPPATCSLQ